MPTIKIEVKDNIAINLTPEIEIVSNNGEQYEVEFSFDSSWDNFPIKTVRFYYNFCKVDVVLEGNVCQIPALGETQLLRVGVFAEDKKTSTDAEIKCRYSIKKYGGNNAPPSKDVYGQIIALLNSYVGDNGFDEKFNEKFELSFSEAIARLDFYKKVKGVDLVKNLIEVSNDSKFTDIFADQIQFIVEGYTTILLPLGVKEDRTLYLPKENGVLASREWVNDNIKLYRHIFHISSAFGHNNASLTMHLEVINTIETKMVDESIANSFNAASLQAFITLFRSLYGSWIPNVSGYIEWFDYDNATEGEDIPYYDSVVVGIRLSSDTTMEIVAIHNQKSKQFIFKTTDTTPLFGFTENVVEI